VLASAAVITGMMALVHGAIGLGVVGLVFMALGFFNPQYLHSLHLI
jgi:K+ transporter